MGFLESESLLFLSNFNIEFGRVTLHIGDGSKSLAWILIGFILCLIFKNTMERLYSFELNNKKIVQSTDKIIKIGKTEYKILSLLMSRPENVFSRDQIIDYVWDNNPNIDDRTVDVHISRLRKIFKEDYHGNCKIETVHGFGYCIRKD